MQQTPVSTEDYVQVQVHLTAVTVVQQDIQELTAKLV